MTDPVEPLILDLLEWIGPHPRPYAEVLDAWRTSCPRLPVWEEANKRGFVEHLHQPGHAALVAVSALGRTYLEAQRVQHEAARRLHDSPTLSGDRHRRGGLAQRPRQRSRSALGHAP